MSPRELFVPPVGVLPVDINNMEDALSYSMKAFRSSRKSFNKAFKAAHLEPHTGPLPKGETDEQNLEKKRKDYLWNIRPDFVPQVTVDFDWLISKDKILDANRLPNPQDVGLVPQPTMTTMEAIEEDNRTKHKDSNSGDFYDAPNIGLRKDWYTDAVFAQQQFTGVNPTSIKLVCDFLLFQNVISAATLQRNPQMVDVLTKAHSTQRLYVQDCRYYRQAAGLKPDEPITVTDQAGVRFGSASVVLFSLGENGKLHPLAITLDSTGTQTNDVTIFNKRLTPDDTSHDEKTDWPWRYAKTVAQCSDWARHEMTVHLTDTHLIEEAIIVAAQRTLPDSHIVLEILNAHWTTTLSLNSLAHDLLVPKLIQPVSPFSLPQVVSFIRDARAKFDFVGSYVPNDLENRGFPISELETPHGPFHNYTYARQVYKTWTTIREYVSTIICHYYKHDVDVRRDTRLFNFVEELRKGDGVTTEGGNMPNFPQIRSVDTLIDVVTMCIHIAAPQHSAVNYLQQFYLAFIPNRPGSLFRPLPTSLQQLMNYGEKELLDALPLQSPFSWMMMAQVPYLLSEEVDPTENILAYAETASKHFNPVVAEAGKRLKHNINHMASTFTKISAENDDKETEYTVLYPRLMASAIII